MPPEVVLDTNFIITCMSQKIDFFEELTLMGFRIVIPLQVKKELEKLGRVVELKLLEKNRKQYREVRFKKGYVDKGMVEYAKKNPKAIIATLDSELKRKITTSKMIIRGRKTLEVV